MGQLIYLIGASGSGKDSVMNMVKSKIADDFPLLFAHRYITKPADTVGENFISLSWKEFELREKTGLFAMNWFSHGYHYGIGVEINDWMEKGFSVVVNGSREYLPEASSLYSDMLVCMISVNREKLEERLLARGRESMEDIKKRLERTDLFTADYPEIKVINNDFNLEDSADKFLYIIQNQ